MLAASGDPPATVMQSSVNKNKATPQHGFFTILNGVTNFFKWSDKFFLNGMTNFFKRSDKFFKWSEKFF
jgi:hypothetical protein